MIYLLVFILSAILIRLSETNNKYKKIIVFFALLLPCLLAGLRNVQVGTDTKWYPKLLYDAAVSNVSFKNYYNIVIYTNAAKGLLYKVSSFEIGFVLLTFFVAKVFSNFQVLLFLIHLIIILPVYFGLKKYKVITNNKLLWLTMLLFYLYTFNSSLNAMRQFMAISLMFYGVSSVINHDKKSNLKFILCLILSFLFHKTGLIGITIVLIYSILDENNKFTNKVIRFNDEHSFKTSNIYVAMAVIISLILLLVPNLLKNIILSLNVEHRFVNYVGSSYSIVGSTIFCLPILLLYFFNSKRFKEIKDSRFYIVMYIIYLFSIQLSTSESLFGSRISYYFIPFSFVGNALLANSSKIKVNRIVYLLIILITALLYWVYNILIMNYNQTMPYLFYF